MKILNTNSSEYGDVINSYYDIEKFSKESDSVLFLGYSASRSEEIKKLHLKYKNRIYLNLESPCSFCSTSSFEEESKYFTHTYTICPYTAEWLRERMDISSHSIAFPYNEDCFKNIAIDKKRISSMYMGTIMCKDHEEILQIIKKRSHAICSLFKHPLVTHNNISSFEKWKILGSSKSNVIINMCPIGDKHKKWIKQNDLSSHKAFNKLDYNFIPQFKPRVIESMVCKSICLVKKDPWNVIEQWFKPDEHFLYWETLDELNSLIENIDNNFDDYLNIANNAFEAVKKYEIKNILNIIRGEVVE
jgi:hypothetical protein